MGGFGVWGRGGKGSGWEIGERSGTEYWRKMGLGIEWRRVVGPSGSRMGGLELGSLGEAKLRVM